MFGTGARLFHWSIALLVAVQIPAGIAMTSEPLAAWADPLFVLHKGLGAVLLVMVLCRIAWRLTHPPPPFPDYMSPAEQRVAHATHVALYGLLLVMAVSGYVRTVGDGYPIELLDAIGIPPLVRSMPEVAAVMLVVHRFTVFALVMLAAAHVAAVIQRGWIDGHPVMNRMWPPFRPKEDDAK
ncbi:MAG: cytochrome b [Gemmatimonadetes bacterium]|nr:cytochrome b/b6 domain-containing protein [Gemmatimonadota bacterium]NNF11953.1 cytochrome b [Gemmatimonadota bacterium]NNL29771.1 cytochrome b [Gemmatimonadota bacterium]